MTDITVRKMAFEWPEQLGILPQPSDVIASCELVGVSLTLPYLEPYLIRTMRAASKATDDAALAADMKAFSAQEAHHHRNHSRINEILRANLSASARSEVLAIEAELSHDYQTFSADRSLRFNLGYAEGFEAMTLGLALNMMEQGFDDIDPDWAGLVEWHLAEEIEHRTVTFDAYDRIFGQYPYRVYRGCWAQWHFLQYVFRFAAAVYRDVEPDSTDEPWASKVRIVRRQWESGLLQRMLRALSPRYSPARIEMPSAARLALEKYDGLATA